MRAPNGERRRATGTFLVIDPRNRPAWSWSGEDHTAVTDTLVTLEIPLHLAGNDVVLPHEKPPRSENRANHPPGPIGSLEQSSTIVREECRRHAGIHTRGTHCRDQG